LLKFNLRSFAFTFIFCALAAYFCYHMLSGSRGFITYFKLNSQISSLKSELELVRAERLTIEHKANLLKHDSLDLDLLEEQAKTILGFARPQEKLFISPTDTE
jgi:cell division protein FtsB